MLPFHDLTLRSRAQRGVSKGGTILAVSMLRDGRGVYPEVSRGGLLSMRFGA